jgi:hypothetical protein
MINVTTHEENALNECPDPQGEKYVRQKLWQGEENLMKNTCMGEI